MSAEILPLGDPSLHFWLTRSVARVAGLNLSEAIARGVLSAKGYGEMVTACRRCPHVHTCQQWLGQERRTRPALPQHCLNHDRLARVASEMGPGRV